MKNTNFFPFERNKYFYGKLLSVEDFNLEQKYMNDKRRMMNRFLFGYGVVAGLYVLPVDERTISIESGYALDSLGRELVVDTPVVRKLSMLDGYEECLESGIADYLYLAIDYDEKETDKVHNITGVMENAGEQAGSFRRIKEGFRLFLTTEEPQLKGINADSLYEETQMIYQRAGVRIRMITPRYLSEDGMGSLRFQVENLTRQYVSFSFRLVLNCLNSDGRSSCEVSFNEMTMEKTGSYEISYPLEGIGMESDHAEIELEDGTFEISLDNHALPADEVRIQALIHIVSGDVRPAMTQEYYRSAMQEIIQLNTEQILYLARIYVIQAGDSVIIEKVDNLPFEQRVMNQVLGKAISDMNIMQDKKWTGNREEIQEEKTGRVYEDGVKIATGTVKIYLGLNGQKGKRFFSEEIVHGLGLGKVFIQIGTQQEDDTILYGSTEVFEASEVKYETAVMANPAKGSFVLGIRLLEATLESELTFHYTVIKDWKDHIVEREERRIFIKPGVKEMRPLETCFFEVSTAGMADKSIQWLVKEQGGSIDAYGNYTAPNEEGVFEVTAQSIAYPEVRASVFVVVRNNPT